MYYILLFSMREPNLNQTMFSFQKRWFKLHMVISQKGRRNSGSVFFEDVVLSRSSKTCRCLVPYHLYWLVSRDQQQLYLLVPLIPLRPEWKHIVQTLCIGSLGAPVLPNFSELCQLGPGFPDTPWRYKCCICPPITNQAPSARGTTSKWKLDWEEQSISANEACFTTSVLVSGRIF